MALMTLSVNAQSLPEHVYPIKSITWGDITWKNGNNKKDKDNQDMYFLMGTGNGYKDIYAEEIVTDGEPTGTFRGYYTYIDYENGETGVPGYGLYYKLTPATSGTLKVCVWVNKGNRKTFVVKGSSGTPLEPWVDYKFEGYVNGQNANAEDGNNYPRFIGAEEMQTRCTNASKYVIDAGNQPLWGWITLDVEADESYVFYQQSSQLGFGGFEFGGESYVASPEGKLAPEFAAVVDADGKATNLDERGSVVTFTAAGVAVEAVGGAVPTDIVGDKSTTTGITAIAPVTGSESPMYSLSGQQVQHGFKGLIVKNGKKAIMK